MAFSLVQLATRFNAVTGEKLETVLTCPEFEGIEYISKIGLRNGVLLVACGDEGIKVFKVS